MRLRKKEEATLWSSTANKILIPHRKEANLIIIV
jgi:hypothetical protein